MKEVASDGRVPSPWPRLRTEETRGRKLPSCQGGLRSGLARKVAGVRQSRGETYHSCHQACKGGRKMAEVRQGAWYWGASWGGEQKEGFSRTAFLRH